jgi:uncharacterized protein YdhG (YjbR/CyaY superfamily)
MKSKHQSVDEYIDSFPETIKIHLLKIREIILTLSPDVSEGISYGMPAFKYNKKPLVYFAAYKEHIGIYATPQVHEKFKVKLAKYKQGKGSVQFPLIKEIPFQLIKEMVNFKLTALKKETLNQ